MSQRLWATVRRASIFWLVVALGIYAVEPARQHWRWHSAAPRAGGRHPSPLAARARSWWRRSSIIFCRATSAATCIRISDTAGPAQSKTRATAVVLTDRGVGPDGAGARRSDRRLGRRRSASGRSADLAGVSVGGIPRIRRRRVAPAVLRPMGSAACSGRSLSSIRNGSATASIS